MELRQIKFDDVDNIGSMTAMFPRVLMITLGLILRGVLGSILIKT